jgi:hypothetical protein
MPGGGMPGGGMAAGGIADGGMPGGGTAGGAGGGGAGAGGGGAGAGGGGAGAGGGGAGAGGGISGGSGGGGPGPPTRLVFLTPPQALYDGQCSAIATVQLLDGAGVPTPARVTMAVSWSTSPLSSSFFTDPACNNLSSTSTIAVGQQTASIYFRPGAVGSGNLQANASTVAGALQPLLVNARPTQLRITTLSLGPHPAASCIPLTLSAQTSSGMPAPLLRPEAVLLGLGAGLAAFSDPSCTAPLGTSAVIPQGASSTTVWIRVVLTGPGSIVASAAFGVDMLTLTGTAAVRRGTCVLLAAALTTTCFVPPPAPLPARSLLVFQARAHDPLDDDPPAHETRCRLVGPDITCARSAPGPVVNITWQILELASGLSVQRAFGAQCSPNPIALATPVNPAQSFVLASVSGGGLNLNDDDLTVARLVGAGTDAGVAVSFEPAGDCSAWEFQVASLSGLTVLHGVSPGFGPGVMRVQTATGLPPASPNTVLLTQLAAVPLPNTAATCYYFARGAVSSPTSLTFTRATPAPTGSCDNFASGALHWQRLDFGTRGRVQQHVVSFIMGQTTIGVPITAVDPTRTLTFLGTQAVQGLALGEVGDSMSGNDELGPATATTELSTPTSVTVTRPTDEESAIFTLYVVELVP